MTNGEKFAEVFGFELPENMCCIAPKEVKDECLEEDRKCCKCDYFSWQDREYVPICKTCGNGKKLTKRSIIYRTAINQYMMTSNIEKLNSIIEPVNYCPTCGKELPEK